MKAVFERLQQDHANLSRLLDLLEEQLDAFEAGDEPLYDMMCEILEYVQSYGDQVHHPTEEAVLRAFSERDRDRRITIEALMDQHEELSRMARSFRDALEGIMQGDVLTRAEVETAGRNFLLLQRQHLDLEDREVLPRLEEMDDSFWEAIQEQVPDAGDPLFEVEDPGRFRSLYRHLTGS